MRTSTAAVLCAFGLALAAGGCAAPLSPLERATRDRAFLERDIRGYAEQLVAQANAEAANLDGQVRVDTCEKRWVIFFEPVPEPEPEPAPPKPAARSKGRPEKIEYQVQVIVKEKKTGRFAPPDTAVRHEWADRYALAQTFEYRWSLKEIGAIQLMVNDRVPCQAEVTFEMRATRRSALVTDLKPVPEPPKGMRVWPPRGGAGFFGVGGTGKYHIDGALPGRTLPGSKVEEVADDALAGKALRKLAEADGQEKAGTLRCTVFYNALARTWDVKDEAFTEGLPGPDRVGWHVETREETGVLPAGRYPDAGRGSEKSE